MKTIHYYLDYENINEQNIMAIDFNKDYIHDVIVFYSDAHNKISIEALKRLTEVGASIRFEKCYNGQKNALDFQLSSLLGSAINSLAHSMYENEFVIVSGDTGYDCLCSFWSERGVKLSRLFAKVEETIEAPVKISYSEIVSENETTDYRKWGKLYKILNEATSKEELKYSLDNLYSKKTRKKHTTEIEALYKKYHKDKRLKLR